MTQSDPPTHQDDPPPRRGQPQAQTAGSRSPRLMLAMMVMAALAGAGAYRWLASPVGGPALAQDPGESANAPAFVKQGDRIVVPQGSPLRAKLVIEAVAAKDIQRSMVLPAVVEADPARTVKVLPPVAGRVVSLKVQLGERVTQGQELAVIDSGDLAQAFSDDEKAKTLLGLTKQALDRQMGLEKSGGAAIKDREQAQSDYAQAVSELERAETRLRSLGAPVDQPTRLLMLKAPASGSVTDLEVAQGDYINDPTATALTISNLDTVWVTANVPEKDTSFVFNGQAVNITFPAYPGQ